MHAIRALHTHVARRILDPVHLSPSGDILACTSACNSTRNSACSSTWLLAAPCSAAVQPQWRRPQPPAPRQPHGASSTSAARSPRLSTNTAPEPRVPGRTHNALSHNRCASPPCAGGGSPSSKKWQQNAMSASPSPPPPPSAGGTDRSHSSTPALHIEGS
eukprot:355767-Chlamydomonas_euryale.AAC.2